MTSCQHLAELPQSVEPLSPEGCAECMALGDRWVHLRLCLSCGNVGCCDSSKNQHASKHYGSSGHPVMQSFQPGESWRWCFVDDAIV